MTMKPSMLAKLEHLSERLTEIDELLMQPEVVSDQENYRRLNREHAELAPVVALYKDFSQVQQDVETAREMLSDPEMKEFAQQEINEAEEKLTGIENDLQVMLLPKIRTMARIFSLKSGPERGETSRRCLPAICSECIHDLPKKTAGRWKSCPLPCLNWEDIAK